MLMTHTGKTDIEGSSSNAYFITQKCYVIEVTYGVACIAYAKVILKGENIFFLGETRNSVGYAYVFKDFT